MLKKIGFDNADEITQIVNGLVHKNVYYYESHLLAPAEVEIFETIFEKLKDKYKFVTHTGNKT